MSFWSKILLFKCYVWMYRHIKVDGHCKREEQNFKYSSCHVRRKDRAGDVTGQVTTSRVAALFVWVPTHM